MSLCVLCNQECSNGSLLTNGRFFHPECHARINDLIRAKTDELRFARQSNTGVGGALNRIVELFDPSVILHHVKRPRTQIVDNLQAGVDELIKTRSRIYDYWPTYPPDWLDRRSMALRAARRCTGVGPHREPLHVHHRTPIFRGGSHQTENLQILCEACHSSEHGGKNFAYNDRQAETSFQRKIVTLSEALSTGSVIKFRYEKYSGNVTRRTVKPLEVGTVRDFWDGSARIPDVMCVRGYCYLRKADRVFRIDKMRGIKLIIDRR